jgi:hypothetical protein
MRDAEREELNFLQFNEEFSLRAVRVSISGKVFLLKTVHKVDGFLRRGSRAAADLSDKRNYKHI